MERHTALLREARARFPEAPPAGSAHGGIAAALAGHLAVLFGERRPRFVVVDPARAACIFETAKAGHPVALPHGEPTVMAMLECNEPSLVAWRILSRVADGFMTVEDEE